jgi:hypothetical protein
LSRSTSTSQKSPLLLPLILVGVGFILLLSGFLFLGEFSVITLAPLLLVMLGLIILLRGDIIPSNSFRPFGISRGNVESAMLQVNAADIDVNMTALDSPERLIAGQYSSFSRPDLNVDDKHVTIILDRAKTPLLTFADWELGLAKQLPWQINVSSYLGQITADLQNIIIQSLNIHTGMGSIHLIAPLEVLDENITLQSVLGNIHVNTPAGYNVRIIHPKRRFFKVKFDTSRYERIDDYTLQSLDIHPEASQITVQISGGFGDAYLS